MNQIARRSLLGLLLCVMVFANAVVLPSQAAVQIPSFGQILSKDATGTLTDDVLTLTLRSNISRDQTSVQIPDGSQLIIFLRSSIILPNKKIKPVSPLPTQIIEEGPFTALARIVSPDRQILIQGVISGVIGVTAQREPGVDNRKPRHMEGVFNTTTALIAITNRTFSKQNVDRFQNQLRIGFPVITSFSTDEIIENGAPSGRFRARLDGFLLPPTSPLREALLSPGRQSYGSDEPIEIFISNDLDSEITVVDGQSSCTILELQRSEGREWKTVRTCQPPRAGVATRIRKNETFSVTLPAVPSDVSSGNSDTTYRVALTYRLLDDNGNPTGEPEVVTSTPFDISDVSGGQPDDVTVETDRRSYKWNDAIRVVVDNDGPGNLLVRNGNSFCSEFVVERKIDDARWETIGGCANPVSREFDRLGPFFGAVARLQLRPTRPESPTKTYRIRVEYQFLDNAGKPTGAVQQAISAPFTIED